MRAGGKPDACCTVDDVRGGGRMRCGLSSGPRSEGPSGGSEKLPPELPGVGSGGGCHDLPL